MEQLDLLCSLDKHYNLLVDYQGQKKYLCDTYLEDEKNMTIIKLERNINVLKNKNKNSKQTLSQTEMSLNGYNYTIKEIEDKLYDGKINDIKQLQMLNEEKDSIKDTISKTENKVLEYMEEIEENEKKLVDMAIQLKNIIKQNYEKKLKYVKIDKDLNISINKEKQEISDIESNIDKKLLNQYMNIRKHKKRAVAEMKNDVCSGCNMGISKNRVEKVKESKDIVYCENCGRILCKQKNQNC